MRNLRDSSIFTFTALTALVACSSDDKAKPDAPPIVLLDAAADATPDSPPPADAQTYDFSCEGVALPTTAAATITLSGTVTTINIQTQSAEPVSGAAVAAFDAGTDVQDGTTKTTPANGTFTMDAHTTATVPYDVYLKATKTGSRTSYTYPPSPFIADQGNIPVLLLTDTAFALVLQLVLSDTQDPTKGAVGVAVVDCAGTPVAAATLKVTQGGVDVGKQHSLGALGAQAEGTWLVLDVPVGDTVISATYLTHTWRLNTIKSFAAATSTTIAAP